jgi:hypothetical protein
MLILLSPIQTSLRANTAEGLTVDYTWLFLSQSDVHGCAHVLPRLGIAGGNFPQDLDHYGRV